MDYQKAMFFALDFKTGECHAIVAQKKCELDGSKHPRKLPPEMYFVVWSPDCFICFLNRHFYMCLQPDTHGSLKSRWLHTGERPPTSLSDNKQ